jgi:hypothetical protein
MNITDHLFVRLKHIMLLMMTLVVVYGAVKTSTEAELREKLAASEMARAKALQAQAAAVAQSTELSAIIKKLMVKAGQDSTTKTGQAAQDAAVAQSTAATAQNTAESTAATIQEAAAAAASAALVAQAQASRFNVNSMTLIWVQVVILVGILGGFVNSALTSGREHKWAMEAAREAREEAKGTRDVLDKVETNTNSMVEIMRKAAFKEGFELGKEEKRM